MRWIFVLILALLTGCSVSFGVFVEKDWRTDPTFRNADLRSRVEAEVSRDFIQHPLGR